MKRKKLLVAIALTTTLGWAFTVAEPANAGSLEASSAEIQTIDGYVIVDGEKTDSKVVSPIPQGSDVLISDGSVEPQSCSDWYQFVAAGTGGWHKSNPGCGFIGTTNDARVGYDWKADPTTSGTACVQGLGYNSSNKAQWTLIGCGTSGGGTAPWGNSSGAKQVRAKATSIPLGFAGKFR